MTEDRKGIVYGRGDAPMTALAPAQRARGDVTARLPDDLWQEIAEYSRQRRTGQITINFNAGEVGSWQANKHVRVKPDGKTFPSGDALDGPIS